MTSAKASVLFGVLTFGTSVGAHGYDACSTSAINTLAHVTTSYNTAYDVETFFRSPTQAAATFSSRGGSLHVVEGSLTWVQTSDAPAELGTDFNRDFAIGHHFHAFLLRFDDLVSNIEDTTITFGGTPKQARKGELSTGGIVYWVAGQSVPTPAGLRFQFGDATVDVTADDWRDQNNVSVPYRLTIDDGRNQFFYDFETVDLSSRDLDWFHSEISAPEIDDIQLLRLHRDILTAHCQNDADRVAELTAPNADIVSSGSISVATPEIVRNVFANTFARRAYASYRETSVPKITVSGAGDIGWAIVELETSGTLRDQSANFKEQWAWTMTAQKVEGRWLMAGNAANTRVD